MNIKTTIIAAIVAIAPLTAQAESYCAQLGQLAYNVMSHRQAGTTMSELMGMVEGDKLAIALVRDAYNEPRFSTPEFKQKSMQDFRNDVEALCYAQGA